MIPRIWWYASPPTTGKIDTPMLRECGSCLPVCPAEQESGARVPVRPPVRVTATFLQLAYVTDLTLHISETAVVFILQISLQGIRGNVPYPSNVRVIIPDIVSQIPGGFLQILLV